MIKYAGHTLTANQFAKVLVLNYGEGADYWEEREEGTYVAMTQREVAATDAAVRKHQERVRKAINADAIMARIYGE